MYGPSVRGSTAIHDAVAGFRLFRPIRSQHEGRALDNHSVHGFIHRDNEGGDWHKVIEDAQRQSMERLLRAWDEEIEAAKLAHLEIVRRQAREDAEAACLAQAVAASLEGLLEQAEGGADEAAATIPEGVRVASTVVGGPSIAALSALISEVHEADRSVHAAQRSAAWALGHQYIPHPGDLAEILGQLGVDAPWAARFRENGNKLDALGAEAFRNPQLQAFTGAQRLDLLRDTVRLLDAYSPDRTLRLVARPGSLLELPGRVGAPPAAAAGDRTPSKRLNRILDSLFA